MGADGELRRVIPIKVEPPKNYLETPALTPKPEPPKRDENEKFSRRDFFGRGRRWVEKKAEAPEKHHLEAARPGEKPTEDEAPGQTIAPAPETKADAAEPAEGRTKP